VGLVLKKYARVSAEYAWDKAVHWLEPSPLEPTEERAGIYPQRLGNFEEFHEIQSTLASFVF
jgi:hypothetical protein